MSQDQLPGQELPDYVRGLLDPAAYPAPPAFVGLRQTHISYVFLADDFVYKIKKPVDFGFVDQTDAKIREQFCHAELRLNRRLAPDVYLDVVSVVRTEDGNFAIDPGLGVSATEIEWAVKMRRLPDDRTLDRLIDGGALSSELIENIVRRLITFHEAAEVVVNDPTFAGEVAEREWWHREYKEAEPFIGDTWQPESATRLRDFIERTIERDGALFDERLELRRVVEGHGDLQAKHIYAIDDFGDDLAIVDCIEFSDWFHFRYLDVGYDIAFLAMDLEALGRPDLGDELVGRYIVAANDETMGPLQPFHRALRAFVRGKVESIGARDPELPDSERDALSLSASRYFQLAAEYSDRRAGPSLVLLTGLPGTGKSTVAGTLAGRIGGVCISSDGIRKWLAGLEPRQVVTDSFATGLYSTDMTDRTYQELRRRASVQLSLGRPVILDAMHSTVAQRRAALEIATEHSVPALIVELQLEPETAHLRIENRSNDPFRTSDATSDVYERQRERFEPITLTETSSHVVLDARRSPALLAREIAEELSIAEL